MAAVRLPLDAFPIGLFGVSIATAVLPAVSRHASLKDATAIRDTVARGMRLMLMLNIPATFGLVVLSTPIVRLLFERRHFQPTDTAATAAALRFDRAGLVGYSTARIVSPVFYAVGRSRVPAIVSAASIAVNIVASIMLVRVRGFAGFAPAASIAAVTRIAAAAMMAAGTLAVDRAAVMALPGRGTPAQAARLAMSIACALAVLVGAAKLLCPREFDDAPGQLVGARDTI